LTSQTMALKVITTGLRISLPISGLDNLIL
jgi:hypothetical protein